MDIGKDLTKRQQEIFDFIKRYSASHGYPPTVRDIGKAVGLASSSTVHAHLANLEKVGLLRRDPSKPRAIELLDKAASATSTAIDAVKSAVLPNGLPLVGHVAAGQPLLAEENIEEYVQIPEIAGGEDGEYLLRVRGDSMIKAGILPDDVVVVRQQDTADDGQIVVALVGEEATVKRYFKEADHDPVVGQDPGILHRLAADPEQVLPVLAAGDLRDLHVVLDVLLGEQRLTGGDVTHEREPGRLDRRPDGVGRPVEQLDGAWLGRVAAQEADLLQVRQVGVHRRRRGEADRLADVAHCRRVALARRVALDEVEDLLLALRQVLGKIHSVVASSGQWNRGCSEHVFVR